MRHSVIATASATGTARTRAPRFGIRSTRPSRGQGEKCGPDAGPGDAQHFRQLRLHEALTRGHVPVHDRVAQVIGRELRGRIALRGEPSPASRPVARQNSASGHIASQIVNNLGGPSAGRVRRARPPVTSPGHPSPGGAPPEWPPGASAPPERPPSMSGTPRAGTDARTCRVASVVSGGSPSWRSSAARRFHLVYPALAVPDVPSHQASRNSWSIPHSSGRGAAEPVGLPPPRPPASTRSSAPRGL